MLQKRMLSFLLINTKTTSGYSFFRMFFRHLFPSFLWALFILILMGMPGTQVPSVDIFQIDKVVHLFVYLVFVQLLIVGFKKQRSYKSLIYRSIPYAVGIGISYGIITEVLQGTIFVARSIELLDMLANAIGCLLGVISFRIVFGKINT